MDSLFSPGTAAGRRNFKSVSLPFLAVFWLVVALLLTVFDKDLWERTWFFITLPAKWVLIGIGVVLFMISIRGVMPDRKNRRIAAAALVIALAGLVLLIGFRDYLALNARFLLSRANYERRVAEVLSGKRGDRADVADIERGPPDRVAFYWKRGVTDNWVGLVYDPSGEALNAASALGLFGGAMTHSRHLTGPWYICWFT